MITTEYDILSSQFLLFPRRLFCCRAFEIYDGAGGSGKSDAKRGVKPAELRRVLCPVRPITSSNGTQGITTG